MPARKGHCTNFGLCGKADQRKRLKIPEGKRLTCPECGQPLDPRERLGRFPWRLVTFLMAVFLLSTAVEVYRWGVHLDGSSHPGAALDLGRIILWLRDASGAGSDAASARREPSSDQPAASKTDARAQPMMENQPRNGEPAARR